MARRRPSAPILAAVLGLLLTAVGPVVHAAPGAPGRTVTGTVTEGGLGYPYRVYVPSTYTGRARVPLLVMIHGCQTTAAQQQRANLLDDVAERAGFIVLYPDVNRIERAQPGPLENCWQFPLPANWHRGSGDPAAIAGMTRTVMRRWKIDRQRVYLVGMSAGAFTTSNLAAAYPDLYTAAAINAGGAYADGLCIGLPLGIPVQLSARLARTEMGSRARVVPRLVMGGDADQGIPPACADKALEQGLRTSNLVLGSSQSRPLSLRPASVHRVPAQHRGGYASTVRTYRDRGGCVIARRWLIHGMNHFWPGGSSDPALAAFTDHKGPNGAEVVWRFLRHYTKHSTARRCTTA